MQGPYRPLTDQMLAVLGELEGFEVGTWTGPALAGPATPDAVGEVLAVAGRLLAADQTLIQVKDAMSTTYTLNGVTATAERFMIGDEPHVEAVAGIRALVITIQAFIEKAGLVHDVEAGVLDLAHLAGSVASWLPHWLTRASAAKPAPPSGDPTTFALEDPRQYAMAWTSLQDIYRDGYRQLDSLVANVFDPAKATEQFWPMLARTALPYNLLVLRRLDTTNVERFKTSFGPAWTGAFDTSLKRGTLYGIDMTIFTGMPTRQMADGTMRFTPCTMTLLEMGADKSLRPVAVWVADPNEVTAAQTYMASSPAWLYALFAVRTSLTVHGIWLGHVFPLHLVTAAMQMTMLGTLPPGHVLMQMLGPHSHSTMAFNFLLAAGWGQLAPPTAVADTGQFLGLAGRYGTTHDYFSNDPHIALAALGLDVADFTDGDDAWNLYPNVRLMLRLWGYVADYVTDVVADLYPTDAVVADDVDLAAWIAAASAAEGGNIVGLPSVRTKAVLAQVLTSLLYRIIFHGMGRLRSISNPEPSFVPNFPPCLQSSRIPRPDEAVDTAVLLREFLPRTGTIGGQLGFYDLFVFTAPTTPLVPGRGADADLFFDESRHPRANEALVRFRRHIEDIVRKLQPEWVDIGQWPMCIEF